MKRKNQQQDNTERYYHKCYHEYGMDVVTFEDLIRQIEGLGYHINWEDSFKYYNTSNPPDAWLAWALDIIHTGTGLGFAHVDAPRNWNFQELQRIRSSCLSIKGGHIIEL